MTPADVLYKYWGYESFRECQLEIIESVLDGRDTIGLLPTGGGKSITFQVPALMLDGVTVVVTPLISLMKDQVDNLRERGIKAGCLNSSMSRAETRLCTDRLNLGLIKILYVSPEKLARKEFRQQLADWDIRMIVVDEAHCISQWGYDFRPSYLNLVELRKLFPSAPVLALTASATPDVVADIASKLDMKAHALISRSFSRDNISYIVRHTDDKEAQLQNILAKTAGSAIVYTRSRRRTVELASKISEWGMQADFYHAGLDSHEKTERQDAWKSGQKRIIVATNAFGMGIDKPDVRLVVHYDLPPSLEEYYQEAGRAGRDGKPAFAVMLASQADKALLKRRLNEEFPGREYILMVYERACNFLEVSVGRGYDRVYEFNLTAFLRTFDLKPAPTLSALRILTRAGVLEFSENYNSRSRVYFLADRRELYDLSLDMVTDNVLQSLLRICSGVFADYIPLDEVRIAYAAHCSPQQVYESLLLLSRMKVLSYIPKSNQPLIYFPTSRDEPRHVVIPRAVYEERLARATERMEAMRDFVFGSQECRVRHMLRYFGELNAGDCGKCDICRLLSHRLDANSLEAKIDAVLDRLSAAHPDGIPMPVLKENFTPATLHDAIARLRIRMDR